MTHRSLAFVVLVALAACSPPPSVPSARADGVAPLSLALAPVAGRTDLDQRIAATQMQVKTAANPAALLERLGGLFVVKARTSYDPGFYKLTQACAAAIDEREPGSTAALLLRGHVAHNLHQFAAAEAIARQLVSQRGGVLDYGLLGDVLLDRGLLAEALANYQKMLDLKPCLQSYARAARVRWLRGDVDGARELMRLAKGAGSVRDPEALAWTYAQLATLELQAGDLAAAKQACAAGLQAMPDAAAVLLAQGRIAQAEDQPQAALASLRRAAERNPLPEYRWALADGLRQLGQNADAAVVEAELERTGALDDPRTFALYLATRNRDTARALTLVEHELQARADVHTHDAHAWALLRSGRAAAAWPVAQKALAEGTLDARLFWHAGAVAQACGHRDDATRWLGRAHDLRRMLLPSEQRDLAERRAAL